MSFKMKGPSMYPNYRGNNPKQQQVQINRDGNPGAADGRAASSPFQMNDDKKPVVKKKTMPAKPRPKGMKVKKKTMEDYIKEGFTPSDARQMMKDGATTGKTSPNKFLGGAVTQGFQTMGGRAAKAAADQAKNMGKDMAAAGAKSLFQQKGSPYKKTDPPVNFPGLLKEVPVDGGKKTKPGSFMQTSKGATTAGNSIEHGKLRAKKKRAKTIVGSKNLTPTERKRLAELDTATERAYKKKYPKG